MAIGHDDAEIIRVLGEGSLDIFLPRPVFLPHISIDAVGDRFLPILGHFVSEECVHGSVEEIRDPDEHHKFRGRQAGFPFIDGAYRDAECISHGLLCERPFFTHSSYVLG